MKLNHDYTEAAGDECTGSPGIDAESRDRLLRIRHQVAGTGTLDSTPAGYTVLIELNPNAHPLYKRVVAHHSPKADETAPYLPQKRFIQDLYRVVHPDYPVPLHEAHDRCACFFFTVDATGTIDSVMRVAFDGADGLPLNSSLNRELVLLRDLQLAIAEPGRFGNRGCQALYKLHIRAIYQLASWFGLDYFVMQNRDEQVSFYEDNVGAKAIQSERTPAGCTNMLWDLKRMPARFARVFGDDQSDWLQLIDGEG